MQQPEFRPCLRTLKLKQPGPLDTLKIGLDVSVDSCGMTITFGELVIGFLFVSNMPPADDACPEINYVEYRKQYSKNSYTAKERTKMWTRRTLANKVEDAVNQVIEYIYPAQPKFVQIVVEGAAYGYQQHSSNSLIELVTFRAMIEDRIYHMWPLGTHISFDTITPTALKKTATGYGKADKLQMIEAAIAKLQKITWLGKIDDFADALHLATYPEVSEPEPRLW